MTTRPTKIITLPVSGAEVEFYTYITGGEKRQVTDILTSTISADLTGQTKGDIPISLLNEANDKAMELLIVSISGDLPLKDLPSKDFDVIVSAINDVTGDKGFLG